MCENSNLLTNKFFTGQNGIFLFFDSICIASGNIDLKPIPYGKIFLLANSPPNKKIVIRRVDIKVILFSQSFYYLAIRNIINYEKLKIKI